MDVEALRARREDRRQAIRRRRRAAVALVGAAAVLAAVVILLVGSLGSTQGNGHVDRAVHLASTAKGHRSPSGAGGISASSGRGQPGSEPVPILMYHVIAPAPAGAPFPGLYVSPAEFAEQMQALKHAGWHAVTLDQVAANWKQGASLGAGRPVVLTFDNGYQSQYTQALPVLRRLGWVADENIQLTGLPPSQGGLGEDEVRGLLAAGWELDTQGISHADLIKLDAAQLHEQIANARATLQRRYHVPVNWFCYPSGHYDATVVSAVQGAGYEGSTTVMPGWAHPRDDRYRLHRLRVLGGTSGQALLALVAGVRDDPPAPSSYGGA
jgi:peptidoglycan/xylan/chitin deacetylase (PgdA/CDA1 family)